MYTVFAFGGACVTISKGFDIVMTLDISGGSVLFGFVFSASCTVTTAYVTARDVIASVMASKVLACV